MADDSISTTGTEEGREYWLAKLAHEPGASNLVLDYPRPRVRQRERASTDIDVPADVAEQLRGLTGDGPLHTYAILLAALKVCLYRYNRNARIVVGSPSLKAPAAAHADGVHADANLLALSDELSDELSFGQLVERIRQTLADAYERQAYPFARLVKDLGLEETLNRAPLFDVLAVMQGVHNTPPELNNDVTIFFAQGGATHKGRVEFDPQLFRPETVERFVNHLLNVLRRGLADTSVRLRNLSLLSVAEREQLIDRWSSEQTVAPETLCVHELFERQAAATPDADAVVSDAGRLTYGELNRRANSLAHYLRARGVGPDVLVGICMERSLDLVVGIIGILKAGGAYLPLDPAYPARRLEFMLSDGQVPVLLTHGQMSAGLPPHDAQVVRLDAEWTEIAEAGTQNSASGASPDNLAYIIYTSGSTGQPKGVAMTHGPLANLIEWHRQHSTLLRGARVLQFASPSFDVSFQEIFTTLCTGGTLFILPPAWRQDITKLPDFLARNEIQRTFFTFVVLQHLAETAAAQGIFPHSLREIIPSGDRLEITEAVINLVRECGDCMLQNQYGPSESHVVTAFNLEGEPGRWPALPPLGRPIANARIYLLDQNLEPVPTGVFGELYVGGVSPSRGYLRRPMLTAEKYLPDPFVGRSGARMYKSGDLARWLPDGRIEFGGRIDFQVKIRGFRVELGEIEAALGEHPAVQKNVVLARENAAGDRRLVAYIVAAGGSAPTSGELHEFLRERVPDYMVPSAYVLLTELPLTPNGKLDRRALPAPDEENTQPGTPYEAPRNQTEETLARIWGETLNVAHVGINDNFFVIGGHSLLATQLISRLRETFRIELPLRTLFESPTVAGLAVEIIQRQAEQADQAVLAQLLSELEALPQEDAQSLLADESQKGPSGR